MGMVGTAVGGRLSNAVVGAKFTVESWWFWEVYGWPKHRRCGQCAGSGTYSTESMARYGDGGITCPMCDGEGKLRRVV